MLYQFIDWLFDMPISVDVEHQELLSDFGVLFLIPLVLFLLSYVRGLSTFIKDGARKVASSQSAASSTPMPPHQAK